jgi:hypothetical protein
VRQQRKLWERALELRILLQRPLAASNRLPQPAVRAAALAQGGALAEPYGQLLQAAADTLAQLLELQAALLASNPAIGASAEALQQAAEAKVGAAVGCRGCAWGWGRSCCLRTPRQPFLKGCRQIPPRGCRRAG